MTSNASSRDFYSYPTVFFTCFLLSALLINSSWSVDGKWEPLGPEGGNFVGVVIDPSDESRVTAITSSPSNVYRSNDGGQTWKKIGEIGDLDVQDFYAWDFSTIYALSMQTLYRSNDGGETWTSLDFPVDRGYPFKFCVHPNDSSTIYVVGYNYNYRSQSNPYYEMVFFTSSNGGRTWRVSTHFQYEYFYPTDISVSHSNPDMFYATGEMLTGMRFKSGLFRSLDGGESWENIADLIPTEDYESLRSVFIDPSDENRVLVTGDYVYRSIDSGNQWNKGALQFIINNLFSNPHNPGVLYAGGSGSIAISVDGGEQWLMRTGGREKIAGICNYFAFSPSDEETMFLATSHGLYISTDGGNRWGLSQNGVYNSIIQAIAVAPSDPKNLYVEQENVNVLHSADGGKTWKQVTEFLACGNINALLVHPSDSGKVLALEGFG